MKKPNVFVIGASGHAGVIIDILEQNQAVSIAGLIDSHKAIGSTLLDYSVLGTEDDLLRLCTEHNVAMGIVAIGDNFSRSRMVQKITEINPQFQYLSAIHPSASISPRAMLSPGTYVAAGVSIKHSTHIGEHAIINTNASVGHDCRLDAFTSLAPNVALGGGVSMGVRAAVCISATVLQGRSVGADTVVGAASLVLKDIPAGVVAHGHPCQVRKPRSADDQYL